MISAVIVYSILLAVAFGLAYWAYRARTDRSALVGLYILFGFPALLLAAAGLVLLLSGEELGPGFLAFGLGMSLPLLAPLRRALARLLPIDPASPVDMAGLCIFLAIVGALFTSSVLRPDPPSEGDLESVGVVDLWLQTALFFGLALAAVGWPTVRRTPEALARLGLRVPTLTTIGVAIGFLVVTLVTYSVIAGVAAAVQPEIFDDLESVTDEMTSEVQSPIGAALIGISAGIGEEALFRGALQPRFGIPLTSLAFALVHAPQYGLSLIILALFAVAVLLGIERQRYGTVAAMATHALYNFIAVMAVAAQ